MKKEIADRIIALGGTHNIKGESLKEDLASISFGENAWLITKDYLEEYEWVSPSI